MPAPGTNAWFCRSDCSFLLNLIARYQPSASAACKIVRLACRKRWDLAHLACASSPSSIHLMEKLTEAHRRRQSRPCLQGLKTALRRHSRPHHPNLGTLPSPSVDESTVCDCGWRLRLLLPRFDGSVPVCTASVVGGTSEGFPLGVPSGVAAG